MFDVQTPEKFLGLWEPHRYKIFYGGRGGAKSRTFARVLLLRAAEKRLRWLCCREVQTSIKQSVKQLLDDEIERLGLRSRFVSTDTEIRNPDTNSLFTFTGLRIDPEKIKSFEDYDGAWIEEAESISERSWDLLTPTIRKQDSEIWASFNPERVTGVLYRKFVINAPPPGSLVVRVGWQDNPWFPDVLRQEMEHCKATDPDKYRHIWEGEPVKIAKGSYYGQLLQRAKDQGRIGRVAVEPTLLVNTAWDLGVDDSTAIWFFQHLPSGPTGEYRVVDYYEASGEGLAHYVSVLRQKGYHYGRHIAPHDIKVREWGGNGTSRLDAARALGVRFDVAPSLSIEDGIEAVRHVIEAAWFDQERCGQGLESLWSYQREWDEINACYKTRPKHDWTSHGSDAFRMLAVGYRPERKGPRQERSEVNFNPFPRRDGRQERSLANLWK
ncbi:MAG: PBSX family phage terminase large subunit [Desulfovibrionaceae bacterium]